MKTRTQLSNKIFKVDSLILRNEFYIVKTKYEIEQHGKDLHSELKDKMYIDQRLRNYMRALTIELTTKI